MRFLAGVARRTPFHSWLILLFWILFCALKQERVGIILHFVPQVFLVDS